jgi:hypothetical protein
MNKKGKKIINDIAKPIGGAPKLVSNEAYRKDFASAGKGDAPRPIDKKKYDENYDNIFRKGEKCDDKCKCKCESKNE